MGEESTRRQRGLQGHQRAVEAQVAQLRFELGQLHHEVGVGRDDAASGSHVVEGVVEAEGPRVHEVGEADGGRAADAAPAVHQHFAASLLLVLCWGEKENVSLVLCWGEKEISCSVGDRKSSRALLGTERDIVLCWGEKEISCSVGEKNRESVSRSVGERKRVSVSRSVGDRESLSRVCWGENENLSLVLCFRGKGECQSTVLFQARKKMPVPCSIQERKKTSTTLSLCLVSCSV